MLPDALIQHRRQGLGDNARFPRDPLRVMIKPEIVFASTGFFRHYPPPSAAGWLPREDQQSPTVHNLPLTFTSCQWAHPPFSWLLAANSAYFRVMGPLTRTCVARPKEAPDTQDARVRSRRPQVPVSVPPPSRPGPGFPGGQKFRVPQGRCLWSPVHQRPFDWPYKRWERVRPLIRPVEGSLVNWTPQTSSLRYAKLLATWKSWSGTAWWRYRDRDLWTSTPHPSILSIWGLFRSRHACPGEWAYHPELCGICGKKPRKGGCAH